MIGRTLGHYQILEQIGAGGMGVVYRARDQHLERDVVLKLIPAELLAESTARQRFRHEALALSRLNHPNIATVHDFDTQDGVDFLVLEHITGETLDVRLAAGPLPERDVLRLGVQLAAGLEAAHEQGVIHRDLKPGNLRITPDGRLKILDFGLARLLETDTARTQPQGLTEAHTVVGTLPYIAPEQLAGRDADARSDLHAAGAVLYEMASGRRAFPQRGAPELMFAITNTAPEPLSSVMPGVSPDLEDVIRKALEKDPELRCQSARELRVDLERAARRSAIAAAPVVRRPARRGRSRAPVVALAAALVVVAAIAWLTDVGRWRERLGAGPIPDTINSLAVLPLDNLTREPDQEYFADGMTDELITCIGKISALRVIARGSVMGYKGTKRSLPDIARALNVAALLEGSVMRSQDRVRISARLIQAASGKLLWSESYDRDLRDVLALQNEVAVAIATAIRVQLTPKEQARFAEVHRVDPAAHEAFLLGQYELNRGSLEGSRRSIEQFKRAIAMDSRYALAHAQLGNAYLISSNWWMSPDVAMPLARTTIRRALDLDPDLPDARGILGYVEAFYDWDLAGAESELRRAATQGASSAIAHQYFGYYLTMRGRFEEARGQFRLARQLDPLATLTRWLSAWPDFYEGRYDRAAFELRELLAAAPEFADGYSLLGETYEQQGDLPAALVQLRRAESLGTHAWTLAAIGRVQAKLGQRDSAMAVIAELRRRSETKAVYVTPYGTAMVYAGLGDRDRAFEWLEKAVHDRSEDLLLLQVDPRMNPLRQDPRFAELLRRIGFPAS